MKTIQVVLEEDLLGQADRQARRQRVNRSELIRSALREYLARLRLREAEERDRKGYLRHPIEATEFALWDKEAAWPDD